ncbi:hypothetical protein ACP70R_041022 [Stipagrostis hirtigluma subsp. patula]
MALRVRCAALQGGWIPYAGEQQPWIHSSRQPRPAAMDPPHHVDVHPRCNLEEAVKLAAYHLQGAGTAPDAAVPGIPSRID